MTETTQTLSISSTPAGTLNLEAQYSGTLPHPSIVQEYERMVPGAAREILDMAKTQMKQRHDLERKEQDKNIYIAKKTLLLQLIGQATSGAIILFVLVSSIYLISVGKSIQGLAALLVPLATVAGVVLFTRKSQ